MQKSNDGLWTAGAGNATVLDRGRVVEDIANGGERVRGGEAGVVDEGCVVWDRK